MRKYSIYIRVSTQKQFDSHLGLEAQTKTCKDYISSVNGEVDKIFVDAKSGKSRDRKGLWDAIAHCKATGQTLVFAKLDRLARDVEFTFQVKNTGIDIYFCDMPVCNTMVLGVFAAVAEYERELISSRTKNALQAKKERGEVLGRSKGCKVSDEAVRASVASKQATARENEHNKRFYRYLMHYEAKNGIVKTADEISALVQDLAALDYRTATGMPFDIIRCRNMIRKVKKLYAS